MTETGSKLRTHPADIELSDYLDNVLPANERERIEAHIASCGECLTKVVSAYEAAGSYENARPKKKGRISLMKKINPYLVLAVITFILSFVTSRYFIQLLVATLLLGIKWIVDSKTTRMLVMIYEAWRKGGEKEASRVLETLDSKHKSRF